MDKKVDSVEFTQILEEMRKAFERSSDSSSKPFNYAELEISAESLDGSFIDKNYNSVLTFSNDLNWPLEYFFAELKSAGIEKKSAREQLTDQDKDAFLRYIIRYYRNGLAPANKLIFSVSSKSTPPKSENKKNENTDECSERPSFENSFLKFSDQHRTPLQRYIAQYSILPSDQINQLWNHGSNDFKGDERQAIYLVYRNNSKKKIQTEYDQPTLSFVKKCPFCSSVFNKNSSVCEGCGTCFSSSPSLLFNNNKEDIKDDENNT